MKKAVVFFVFAFLFSPAYGLAISPQEPSHEAHHPEAQAKPEGPEEQVPEGPQQTEQDLMSMNKQMMKKMHEMNSALDQKLEAMNAAKGEQNQIAAMQAVINEMASQRKQLMDKIMSMQGKMGKTMEGMSGGGMSTMTKGPGMKVMRSQGGKEGKNKNMIVIIQE